MDAYYQKKISRALSTLLKAKASDAFVIFEEKETGKYVQFAGSVREPLLFDLPVVALDNAELKRACAVLGREPETEQIYTDPTATVPAGEMAHFTISLGRDIQEGARLTCAIFRDVYQFPPDFQLTINQNPPSFIEKLRSWLFHKEEEWVEDDD